MVILSLSTHIYLLACLKRSISLLDFARDPVDGLDISCLYLCNTLPALSYSDGIASHRLIRFSPQGSASINMIRTVRYPPNIWIVARSLIILNSYYK